MLKAQGFTVYGVFLSQHGSSSEAAVSQAAQLGIPLSIKDITPRLEREVCAAFSAAYISGRTPNPCILCNPSVKFPALVEEADALGAYHIATGHYAAAELGSDGWTYLKKGRPENDQSYMLCRLPQEILRRVVFPLSDYRKEEARAYASQHGLLSAKTPDSMEICFIPDGDYAAWLERRGHRLRTRRLR